MIPWLIDGKYWKVNIRRCPSQILGPQDKRYLQAAGGANGLYGANDVYPGCTVIITEGEFDALCIRSFVTQSHNVIPVATGSTMGAHMLGWIATIAKADRILIAFDSDDSGNQAAEWWLNIFGDKASRLSPTQHDVTDMVAAGDNLVTRIADGLKHHQ